MEKVEIVVQKIPGEKTGIPKRNCWISAVKS